MPDFGHFSSRYTFRTGLHGQPGEIPKINLGGYEDPLPPFDRACLIKIDMLHKDLAETTLSVYWQVEEEEVYLTTLRLRVNDPRLLVQYKEKKEEVDALIEFLTQAFSKRGSDHPYPKLEWGHKLTLEEVPELFRPAVEQVTTWGRFVNQHRKALSWHQSAVTGDDYLGLGTGPISVMPHEPKDEDEDWVVLPPGSYFDLKDRKLEILDDAVCWEFLEEKILVVLAHNEATNLVAEHYGYLPVLEEYRKKKAEESARFEEVSRDLRGEDNEKVVRAKEALRKSLLGEE